MDQNIEHGMANWETDDSENWLDRMFQAFDETRQIEQERQQKLQKDIKRWHRKQQQQWRRKS